MYTAKIQFKLGKKPSSSNLKFQTRECQKLSADRKGVKTGLKKNPKFLNAPIFNLPFANMKKLTQKDMNVAYHIFSSVSAQVELYLDQTRTQKPR